MEFATCRGFCLKKSRNRLSVFDNYLVEINEFPGTAAPFFIMNELSPEISQLARLLSIVRELRERCPWDREQTLADMGKYLIEEAYEAANAIASGEQLAI